MPEAALRCALRLDALASSAQIMVPSGLGTHARRSCVWYMQGYAQKRTFLAQSTSGPDHAMNAGSRDRVCSWLCFLAALLRALRLYAGAAARKAAHLVPYLALGFL